VRANQGHSVEVDLLLEPVPPPPLLYHGTAIRFGDSIRKSGLEKRARHHVHLSADVETAVIVGRRHGSPLVFVVDAGTMAAGGVPFFRSANGVWLVDHVLPQYLSELAPEPEPK
jgi:putative RNA 2'-phosphotransferase